MLGDWVKSEENLHLYHQLIEDFCLWPTPEDFLLILAMFLYSERLLFYVIGDIAQPIRGNYPVDLDAILNSQNISSKQTVVQQINLFLLRLLYTLENTKSIHQCLAELFDKESSLLDLLDCFSDQYCTSKICAYTHDRAFEKAREGLLK